MLIPISIGNNCRPRYQIDRFMINSFKNYHPNSYFFDYLMMGGINGVIDIINRDFKIVKEDICIYEQNGRFIPRDKSSGMAFLHDFGCRHSRHLTYLECEMALNNALDESLSKYSYLGQKTKNLLSSNIDVALIYVGSDTKENFYNLRNILKTKYQKNHLIVNVLEAYKE